MRAGQAYAVNGQRPESNNFLIDGANNFNGVDGGFVLKPPVDAITEFKILTHNASAEFGNSLGSTTNIITRSGTNQIHGAAWEFFRNDVFDAANYFAVDGVEPLKQNQFGVTLGGPIRKDKTFIFGYFEGFRNRQGETDSSTVPSLAERNGDFSAICTEGFDPIAIFAINPDHQLANIFLGPSADVPKFYPRNQLPMTVPDISPFALSLLDQFPLPNTGTNVFQLDAGRSPGFEPVRIACGPLPHSLRCVELPLRAQRRIAIQSHPDLGSQRSGLSRSGRSSGRRTSSRRRRILFRRA